MRRAWPPLLLLQLLLGELRSASQAQLEASIPWAIRAGGKGTDYVERMAMDPVRALFVMGRFGLWEGFSGTFGGTTLTSEGGQDLYEMKVQADTGIVDWALKSQGTVKKDPYRGKAIHYKSGTIYETGRYLGTKRFGAFSLASEGYSQDAYLSQVVNGTVQWVRSWGDVGNDAGRAVAAAVTGDGALVAGHFSGTVKFDDTNLTSLGYHDAFVMQVDSEGDVAWVKQFGGEAGNITSHDIAATSEGVYLTGCLEGTVDLDVTTLTSRGACDVFALKLAVNNGTVQWAVSAGGAGEDEGTSIVAEDSGQAFIAGRFHGTANFGDAAGALESAGSSDAFVMKVGVL